MPEFKKTSTQTKPTIASLADPNLLYEQSVQCVEAEIDFIDQTFYRKRGRKAITLREDFCGTASIACEWVKRRNNNHAIAIDKDSKILTWAKKHNIAALTPAQNQHIKLMKSNVLKVTPSKTDISIAMNFSYYICKQRTQLINYFKSIRKCLTSDGILFLDAFGGAEAYTEMQEETQHDDFTYIWEQKYYNPITNDIQCKIHFTFKDGSSLKDAFTYEWRLWSLPELQEALVEAKFKPTIYWEGTDKNGAGNGVYTPSREGDADPSWVAYIIAEK